MKISEKESFLLAFFFHSKFEKSNNHLNLKTMAILILRRNRALTGLLHYYKVVGMRIVTFLLLVFTLVSCSKEAPEGCLVCYDNCISVNDPFYDGLCLSEFRNGGPGSDTFAFFSGLTWTLSAERGLDIKYSEKELPPVCSNSFSDNGAWAEARDDLFHTYSYCKEQ